MPSIFVSYRRTDAPAHAGRIYDRLVDRFGNANVFKDIDSTAPGADFAEVINQTITRCDAVVAVIGRDWASASRRGRKRRPFDDPQDWVRREIAAALERNIRVVPVLVEGAEIPSPDQLPDDLKLLTRRHAVQLSETAWTPQLDQLIDALAAPSPVPPADRAPTSPSERPHPPAREPAVSRRLRTAGARRQTRQLVVAGASALIAIGAAVLALSGGASDQPNQTMSREPGTAGARVVSLYRERVGDVCDEVNLAEKARRRDDRRLGSALRAARSTLAQRDALLDLARKSAARSSHAFSGFAALSTPRADAATDRSTTEAWKRNLARLRAYIERLDRTTDYAGLLAAVDRLSRDRSGLSRDGLVVNTGLKRLGANRCVIDPPVVTRTITLPAEPRANAPTSRSRGGGAASATAPATGIPSAPNTGAGAGRSVTPRVNTPQQSAPTPSAPKPRVNTPSSDGPVSGGGEDG